MRRLIISLGILVGMVVAAAFIVPAFIDLNRYKGEIQSQVQKITGQPLELKGGIRLRLLPAPFIKIEGLVFGRTPDGRAIAQIEALSLSAELLPLLKKRLVIQAVDLQKPHVDIVGVQNVLAQMGASSAKTQATKVPMEGQMAASGSTQGADFQLQIQSATLKDGTFVYKKGQATHTLSKVMVKASLGGVQGPLNIDTQGEWNGIPVDVDVAADKLWGDMPINVRATLAGARMKFRGTANIDTQSASGTLNLALPEEMTKPAAVHVGQLRQGASVLAQVEATAEHLQIINAELDMGSVRARGAVDITLGDKVGVRGQFSNLPGGGVLQLSTAAGQDPMVIDLSLKAAKVAEFLKGMEISAPRLPQELAAGSLAIKAGLRLLDGAIDVPTLHVQAGQASLNGSLRVKTAKQPTQVEFKFTTTTPQALAALAGQSFPSGFTTLGASGAVTLGEATQLNVDLKAESLSAKIQGSIGPDDQHNLNVGLTHPDAASLVAKFGVTPSPIKGAVLAATQVAGSAKQTNLTILNLNVGGLGLKGSAKIDLTGARPKLTADLQGQALKLDELLAFLENEQGSDPYKPHLWLVAAKGSVADKWSKDPLDLKSLNSLDADVRLSFPSISQADMVFEKVAASLQLAGGILSVQNLQAQCYGGQASATASLDTGRSNALRVTGQIQGAKLRRLVQTEGRFKIKNGLMNASLDVTGAGRSIYDLVASLKGRAGVSASDGVLSGINLKGLRDQLKDLRKPAGLFGLAQSALTTGETRFSKLDAQFTIDKGVANLSTFVLDAEGATGSAQGVIDLPRYVMDIKATFRLSDLPNYPPVGLRVVGALDNPEKTVDTAQIEQFILQNVANKVLEKTHLGKKLNKLLPGVIPQNEEGAEQAQPDQGAPQKEKPSKEKGSDPLKDIKKNPEKAIEGLLKGLMK